jgi:tetratricopeptide (TPR) repeat protein
MMTAALRSSARHLLALAACIVVCVAPAFAQEKPQEPNAGLAAPASAAIANFVISTCPDDTVAPHEAEDEQLLRNLYTAFGSAGFPAVRAYLPRLREALDHAPACYPQVERRGQAIVIRTGDQQEYLTLSLLAAGAVGASGQSEGQVSIAQAPSVYSEVSFILGSYANENHNYEEAIGWLDRGLALQPQNQYLISEKATALSALNRKQEAYDLLRAALDDPLTSLALDRARFQRMAGVILIDLDRLDEAEAALNESIRLQPNNPNARSELTYIARLRAGQQRSNAGVTAPNAPTPQTQ